jgi:hypothetical protein
MKNFWTKTFRRLAAGAIVSGATAFYSAMCYAQVAADTASDVVYADGWQAGDNGGFGFTAWSFAGTANTPAPGQQAIDNGLQAGGTGSAPYNNIGQAWTLYNPNAPNQGTDNPPSNDTDISQAGRGFAALQPGQVLSIVLDNPIERNFFRGFTVRFNSGGANDTAARLRVGTFEYFSPDLWFTSAGDTPLFMTDTDAGLRLDLSLIDADTYRLGMTPLDNPGLAYTETGTLGGDAGTPINWVEFELYNTDSDFYPTAVSPAAATDFYVSGMQIIPEPTTGVLLVLGAGVLVAGGTVRRRKTE